MGYLLIAEGAAVYAMLAVMAVRSARRQSRRQ